MSKRILNVVWTLVLLLALGGGPGLAQDLAPQGLPLSTGFTYQGRLEHDGEPIDGECAMAFRLFDAPTDGIQIGETISETVSISEGRFTQVLDFGDGVFIGDARWLGIRVMCPGDADFADLGRQELTAAPYATYALGAPWDGLSDMPAGFADGVDDNIIYNAGYGLDLTGTTFGVITDTVQQRVTGVCGMGYAIREIYNDGTVLCEPAGNGDITAVIAGDGLSGGGDTGSVTLTVAFSGTGTLDYAARSNHDHDGDYTSPGHTHTGDEITTAVPTATYALQASTATIASNVEPGVITPTHLHGITDSGANGQVLVSDGSGSFAWQTPTAPTVRQLVQDFVVASGESVSAGDVVEFLNGQVLRVRGDWEPESVFNAAHPEYIAVSSLSPTSFVVAYDDGGNSEYGTTITGTASEGTLSWGPESVFNAATTWGIAVSSLSLTDFVIAYRDGGNSWYGTAIAGTVSGTTLFWGSESVFNAATTWYIAVSSLSPTSFVVAYTYEGNSYYGTAIVGTVSGGTLSWGPESVFNAAETFGIAVSSLSLTSFVVAYTDGGNSGSGTAITGTVSGTTLSWGPESVFNAASTDNIAVSRLSPTDFVIAYRDIGNSSHGTAIVGTVSEGTLSWGSESIFNAVITTFIAVSRLSATDFVIAYTDWGNSLYGTAITGAISGTTLIWGSESVFNAAETNFIAVSSLSPTDFVIAYGDWGNSGYGTAIVGTVSGGTPSWGSESVFNAASTDSIAVSRLSPTDFVITYWDGGNSGSGTAIVGTVSGTTLSWGSESVFNAATTWDIAVSSLSPTDFVVAYCDVGNSDYGTAIVGTVSGTTLSWRPASVFNAAATYDIAVSSLSPTDFVVAYRDYGNSEYGTAIVGAVSGTTLSWGPESVFNAATTYYIAVSSLSFPDFIVAYRDDGNSYYGTAIVGHLDKRLIGTARTAASGGETVPVIIDGVSDMHSGLVPGQMYYLQEDGALGLTPTQNRVGLAISETALILDQMW